MPSRTTRKSYRPRASDRPMGCQPGNRSGLSASETDRRRRYSIRMQPRWNYARSTARPKRLASRTGAGRQGNIFSFPSREKNVLDFSSYRPGVCTSLRCLFSPARRTSGSRSLLKKPLPVAWRSVVRSRDARRRSAAANRDVQLHKVGSTDSSGSSTAWGEEASGRSIGRDVQGV